MRPNRDAPASESKPSEHRQRSGLRSKGISRNGLIRFISMTCGLGFGAAFLALAAQKTLPPAPTLPSNSPKPTIGLVHQIESKGISRPVGGGDPDAWQSFKTAAKEAQRDGRLNEAEQYLASAVTEARGFPPGDRRLLESINEWSRLALNRQRHEQARQMLNEILSIPKTPQDSLTMADSLSLLGEAAAASGQTEQSLSAYDRALIIYRKRLGGYHPTVGLIQGAIARIYVLNDRFAEAEVLFRKALEIALAPKSDVTVPKGIPNGSPPRPTRLPDYRTAAALLTDLGSLCEQQERSEEAESYYQKALQAVENHGKQNSEWAARIQYDLGALYLNQKRLDKAERLLKKSLASLEQTTGSNTLLLVDTLDSLAKVYAARKEPTKEKMFRQRAAAVKESMSQRDLP